MNLMAASAATLALIGLATAPRVRADAPGAAGTASGTGVAGAPGERAEASLMGAAVNRFVARQLPASLQLRGDRASGIAPLLVTLTEARYCRAIDAGHGRLVSIVRTGKDVAAAEPALLTARDCQDKLDQTARRLTSGTDTLAVVEVVAEWAPSRLRFVLGNLATGGPDGAALGAALSRAKAAGPLEEIDTAGIDLTSGRGGALKLDLAIAFVEEGDAVVATFTPAGARGRDAHPSWLARTGAPAATDLIAGAVFPLANRVIALFGQDGPVLLDVQGQSVEVRGLELSGASDLLTVRGRATLRSLQESARLTIQSAGADLKVVEVHAEPELEDCGAPSALAALGCRARNSARIAGVSSLAATLTSRYQGQLLRSLIGAPAFSFDLGRRHLTVHLTPTRVRTTSDALVVYGRGDLD